MAVNPQEKYLETQVQTATPEKLITMLLDGAIRFSRQGEKFLREQRVAEANNSLIRAQNILFELMGSLDMDRGEIASGLFTFYQYAISVLIEANTKKDPAKLEQLTKLLAELRDSWIQATTSIGVHTRGDDHLRLQGVQG